MSNAGLTIYNSSNTKSNSVPLNVLKYGSAGSNVTYVVGLAVVSYVVGLAVFS